MAVEDDAVLAEPPQDGDRRRELVDHDDVKGLELAPRGPVGRRGEGRIEREEYEGQKGQGREVVEGRGEEERPREVKLAEHGADDGEPAEDRPGKDRVAEDVHFQGACSGGAADQPVLVILNRTVWPPYHRGSLQSCGLPCRPHGSS